MDQTTHTHFNLSKMMQLGEVLCICHILTMHEVLYKDKLLVTATLTLVVMFA